METIRAVMSTLRRAAAENVEERDRKINELIIESSVTNDEARTIRRHANAIISTLEASQGRRSRRGGGDDRLYSQ